MTFRKAQPNKIYKILSKREMKEGAGDCKGLPYKKLINLKLVNLKRMSNCVNFDFLRDDAAVLNYGALKDSIGFTCRNCGKYVVIGYTIRLLNIFFPPDLALIKLLEMYNKNYFTQKRLCGFCP